MGERNGGPRPERPASGGARLVDSVDRAAGEGATDIEEARTVLFTALLVVRKEGEALLLIEKSDCACAVRERFAGP